MDAGGGESEKHVAGMDIAGEKAIALRGADAGEWVCRDADLIHPDRVFAIGHVRGGGAVHQLK